MQSYFWYKDIDWSVHPGMQSYFWYKDIDWSVHPGMQSYFWYKGVIGGYIPILKILFLPKASNTKSHKDKR